MAPSDDAEANVFASSSARESETPPPAEAMPKLTQLTTRENAHATAITRAAMPPFDAFCRFATKLNLSEAHSSEPPKRLTAC